MIQKVISGGQSGVDLAGLDAAKQLGIATGGWMPKGWLTEGGPRPEYAERYGLAEMPTADYPARTRKNVEEADATLILYAGRIAGGTALTRRTAKDLGRLWTGHDVTDAEGRENALWTLRWWLCDLRVKTLNVAGPRESKQPGVYALALAFLLEALRP